MQPAGDSISGNSAITWSAVLSRASVAKNCRVRQTDMRGQSVYLGVPGFWCIGVQQCQCCKSKEGSATDRHERSIRLPARPTVRAAAVSPDTQQQVLLYCCWPALRHHSMIWRSKTDALQATHVHWTGNADVHSVCWQS